MRELLPICLALLVQLTMLGEVHAFFAANFEDDRILVGAAHDVFVGKVVERIGNAPISNPMPHTRFRVEVIATIKGNLQGEVFVDQSGGYRGQVFYRADGDVIRPGKDAGMLEPGSTYVLATRSPAVNSEKVHRLNSHPKGHALISADADLPKAKLSQVVESSERVKQLREAYRNEIIPEAFRRDARNRYQPPTKINQRPSISLQP